MFFVGRDASVHVEAELLKDEAEKRFSAIVEKGADMVGIVDSTGKYNYISPSVAKILRHTNLEGKNAENYIHPDDQQLVQQACLLVFKTATH